MNLDTIDAAYNELDFKIGSERKQAFERLARSYLRDNIPVAEINNGDVGESVGNVAVGFLDEWVWAIDNSTQCLICLQIRTAAVAS